MKKISILGSTGSIGTQALEVIRKNKEDFCLLSLSAARNVEALYEQVMEFRPKCVCVYEEKAYENFVKKLHDNKVTDVTVVKGMEGLIQAAVFEKPDILLTCVVGMVGLLPTIQAIDNGIDIALANKETLVAAGDIVMKKAKEKKVKILPVDSEHSAIFQCLVGEEKESVKRLLITASGGAFRGMSKNEVKNKKAKDALKHPNWSMGEKITIDSATLMNKGLEIIEAHHLFAVPLDKIQVYVHRQSLIHSMVEFDDNFVKAQISIPSMTGAISYAFYYPHRKASVMEPLDFLGKEMTFEEVDEDTFPCIKLAKEALKQGGTAPCVLNSANEELVYAYLRNQIQFYDINEMIQECLSKHTFLSNPSIEDILQTDAWAREYIKNGLKKR